MKYITHFIKIFIVTFLCLMLSSFCASCRRGVQVSQIFTVLYTCDAAFGEILGEAEQQIKEGEDTVSVTAKPKEGYAFIKWSDELTTPIRTDKNVKENITVTAIFEKRTYTVSYGVNGNGTLQGEAEQTVIYSEDAAMITAIPNEGYKFVKWSDGLRTATRTDRAIKANINVIAQFEKLTYTVNYRTDGSGIVQGKFKQVIAYGEDAAMITAIPNEGYKFVKWSDGLRTATRMDKDIGADINVTAQFEKITYNVIYVIHGNGRLQGESEQTVKYGENATTVIAIPDEDSEFVGWSDDVKSPQRTDGNVNTNITVAAKFCKKIISVNYTSSNSLGDIIDLNEDRKSTYLHYEIKYGEDAPPVKAIPDQKGDEKYVFLGWSDGVTTEERHDLHITSSPWNITAYFGYKVEYKVNEDIGGVIEGSTLQKVLPDGTSESVKAVAKPGYVFTGWSDLSMEVDRRDKVGDHNDGRNLEFIAYFEPIEKTFRYDYGLASGAPTARKITLARNAIQSVEFIVPKLENYYFHGWYADKEYQTKVANENGMYMLGYYGFTLETDTIYAKWERIEDAEKTPLFKILFVFVNEVEATLYPAQKGSVEEACDVRYVMTSIEREYCALAPIVMSRYLNDWFGGEVIFEIDSYYLTERVSEESFLYVPGVSDLYALATHKLLAPLVNSYHSFLTVFGLNDYDGRLANRSIAGSAHRKYADIYIEGMLNSAIINDVPLQDRLNTIKTDERKTEEFIDSFLHEFIHTCEHLYAEGEIMNFHNALYGYLQVQYDPIEAMRLYLVNKITYNGEIGGIPKEFWDEKKEELLKIIW